MYADLVAAGERGVMRSALTGSGDAGVYRRNVLNALVHEGRVIERPELGTSNGRRYWADVHAP